MSNPRRYPGWNPAGSSNTGSDAPLPTDLPDEPEEPLMHWIMSSGVYGFLDARDRFYPYPREPQSGHVADPSYQAAGSSGTYPAGADTAGSSTFNYEEANISYVPRRTRDPRQPNYSDWKCAPCLPAARRVQGLGQNIQFF